MPHKWTIHKHNDETINSLYPASCLNCGQLGFFYDNDEYTKGKIQPAFGYTCNHYKLLLEKSECHKWEKKPNNIFPFSYACSNCRIEAEECAITGHILPSEPLTCDDFLLKCYLE